MEDLEEIKKKIWGKPVFQKVEGVNKSLSDKQYIYGEITEEGFDELICIIKTEYESKKYLKGGLKLLDVGSGFGKIPFSASLLSYVEKSHGVEIDCAKHKVALANLKSLGYNIESKCKLFGCSFTELENIDYNIVFHNSLTWGDDIIQELHDIFKNKNVIFITTKYPNRFDNVENIKTVELKYTWNPSSKKTKTYIYKLIDNEI